MRYSVLLIFLWPFFSAAAQGIPEGSSEIQIRASEPGQNPAEPSGTAASGSQVSNSAVSFLLDAGVQYADEGEYAEAERAYLRALDGSPGHPEIRFRLGTLYIQTGRFRDAVALLSALADEYPDSSIVQNNLAWLYATGGEMKNGRLALRHAREAILITPYVPSAWNTLAEAYYISGQYAQALRSSEHALDLLRMQEHSEENIKEFEGQRVKILRAAEAYKTFSGLDRDE